MRRKPAYQQTFLFNRSRQRHRVLVDVPDSRFYGCILLCLDIAQVDGHGYQAGKEGKGA
jgi:hypothetical protein